MHMMIKHKHVKNSRKPKIINSKSQIFVERQIKTLKKHE
jgi:hypothetical protein